jgi:hypothetical protein
MENDSLSLNFPFSTWIKKFCFQNENFEEEFSFLSWILILELDSPSIDRILEFVKRVDSLSKKKEKEKKEKEKFKEPKGLQKRLLPREL